MYFIYKVINKINNKVYIGKTSNFEERKIAHIRNALNEKNRSNTHFCNAIRKYGESNFIWIIIAECKSLEEANHAEIGAIFINKAFGEDGENHDCKFGYNMTLGGDGGNTWQCASIEEVLYRKRVSRNRMLGNKYNKSYLPEVKSKIRQKVISNINSRTEQEKSNFNKAVREGLLNYYQTERSKHHREVLSKVSKGQNNSMSLQNIAKRNKCTIDEARKYTPQYGKERSSYVKEVASRTHKGKIVSKATRELQSKNECVYVYNIVNTITNKVYSTDNLYLWCEINGLPYSLFISRSSRHKQRSYRKYTEWHITRSMKKELECQ